MAELPDLEVYAQILSRRFKGKILKELEIKVSKKLNVSPAELTGAIVGKKLSSVSRYGKTLHFHFGEQVLQVHLMLRGELVSVGKDTELPKYVIIAFGFSAGEGFAVRDMLRAATLTLNPAPSRAPDALDMELEHFAKVLSKSKKTVKEVMMDQTRMRGIGNSYADEILWEAGISPFSVASAIPLQKVEKLFESISAVLEQAIGFIAGENGDQLKGELRDAMKVHGAGIEKSPSGAEVRSEKIRGRTAYYTDEQQLYK